jgi:hypothetical protein
MIVLNCIKNDCDCIKQLTIQKHELNAVLQLCNGENKLQYICTYILNRIGGVIASELASSAVDCEFEPRSDQTKDHKISIRLFCTKHAALRRKSHCLTTTQQFFSCIMVRSS